jgi:hypothetical protein
MNKTVGLIAVTFEALRLPQRPRKYAEDGVSIPSASSFQLQSPF